MKPQTALHNVIALGMKATLRVASFDPVAQHRLSSVDLVPHLYGCLKSDAVTGRNDNLGLRTKANHAEVKAPLHRFTGFQGADDTPGNQSGNLTDEDGDTRGASETNLLTLVDLSCLGSNRIAKFTRNIPKVLDYPIDGNPVHVNIENRKEDVDSQGRPVDIVFVFDDIDSDHLAIGG